MRVTVSIPCMLISMRAYRNIGFVMHTHLQYVVPCVTADVMVSDQGVGSRRSTMRSQGVRSHPSAGSVVVGMTANPRSHDLVNAYDTTAPCLVTDTHTGARRSSSPNTHALRQGRHRRRMALPRACSGTRGRPRLLVLLRERDDRRGRVRREDRVRVELPAGQPTSRHLPCASLHCHEACDRAPPRCVSEPFNGGRQNTHELLAGRSSCRWGCTYVCAGAGAGTCGAFRPMRSARPRAG